MLIYDSGYSDKASVRKEWALYSLQSLSATKLARIINRVLQGDASLYNSARNEKKNS